MTTFSTSIDNVEINNSTLTFILSGTDEYGLDKSIVNSLRRTLLSEIPCVAFRVDEDKEKDIVMELNNTSLHNEFLMHRLSMIPLYINPETYENQYLFYLNVKHDSSHPFKFVTTDDIKIFPLKDGIDITSKVSLDNYDLNKPLSKNEHKNIFRPFQFKGKEYPILLTELKSTNVEDNYQELICYGVPSVSDGREKASWKSVSDAIYTFLPNEELFLQVAKDKAGQKNILDEEELETFTNSLRLSEGERYFHRDINNEPNRYTFTVTSLHHKSSKELFIESTELMIQKIELVKQHIINITTGGETSVVIESSSNENNYIIKICGQNDTLGNVLQSHIVNHYLDKDSLLNFCGYKKSHPLEEYITLYIGFNPKNNIYGQSEELKLNSLIKFMDEISEDLISMYRDIGKEAMKSL